MELQATSATPYPATPHSAVNDPGQNLAKSQCTAELSFGHGPCFDGESIDSSNHGSVTFRTESICDDSESVCVTNDVTNDSEGESL